MSWKVPGFPLGSKFGLGRVHQQNSTPCIVLGISKSHCDGDRVQPCFAEPWGCRGRDSRGCSEFGDSLHFWTREELLPPPTNAERMEMLGTPYGLHSGKRMLKPLGIWLRVRVLLCCHHSLVMRYSILTMSPLMLDVPMPRKSLCPPLQHQWHAQNKTLVCFLLTHSACPQQSAGKNRKREKKMQPL